MKVDPSIIELSEEIPVSADTLISGFWECEVEGQLSQVQLPDPKKLQDNKPVLF